MRKVSFLILVGVALMIVGCGFNINRVNGSGRVIAESRSVSNFNALSVSGAGEFTVTQGDTEELTVQAEDNIVPLIKTEVKNGTLEISFDQGRSINPTKPIKFDLRVKSLDAVNLSGAANFVSANIKSDQLSLIINGAGNVKIDQVAGNEVNVNINGAGNVDLGGNVTKQTANLNGLGSYRAANLQSETGSVGIAGAGSATVWTSQNLDVTISGAGSVNYYGSPKVTQRITGMGSVKNLGSK